MNQYDIDQVYAAAERIAIERGHTELDLTDLDKIVEDAIDLCKLRVITTEDVINALDSLIQA